MAESIQGHDGLPAPRRYWSVAAIALAITMAVLDGAIVSVALPTIAGEFGIAPADAIWIVNAYQLAIVVSLLPLASLAESVGYARIYMVGLSVFVAASLACALSTTLMGLTLSRVVQGLGAAGIMSINAALVRFTFPSRLLGRGVGFNALIVSVASAAGPSIAAAILSVGTWPWLFAVNVPFGLAALAIARVALPRPPTVRRRFDAVAVVLNAALFGFFFLGVDILTRSGSPLVGTVLVVGAVAAGVALVRRESGDPRPLLPLDLLRVPIFALSMATSVCSFAAQMLALLSLPFFFQQTMGRSVAETGLLLTPWPIAVGLVGPIAGAMSDRFPAAILGAVGLAIFGGGLGLLAWLHPDASTLDVAWRMAVCGLGFGLFQAPNNRTIIASAPRHRSGAAGGMLATARLTGQTLGATMVALFFALVPGGPGEALCLGVAAVLALGGALSSVSRMAARLPDA